MSDDPMVAVLGEHREDYSEHCCDWHDGCTCGWSAGEGLNDESTYAAHLADVLRAAGYIHRDEQETSA